VADQTDRHLFLVEHDLRGLLPWQLATVHRALGEAVRRENGRDARSAMCSASTHRMSNGACACSRPQGRTWSAAVNDIAQFPLARVMTVLSSVPGDAQA
jgi:hypothetical protein